MVSFGGFVPEKLSMFSNDPWILRGTTRRPRTPNELDDPMRLCDLMDQGNACWDEEEMVRFVFYRDDAKEVIAIPIRPVMEDEVSCHFESKGIFSVKSPYRLGFSL
jgi:hypothetical protein